MTYDIYRYIFIGGAGLAGLCLTLSVILFFVLKIPRVIGDITGATARKAIESIRMQNESGREKNGGSDSGRRELGKLRDQMFSSASSGNSTADRSDRVTTTAKIRTAELAAQAQESYETQLLEDNAPAVEVSDETTVLDAAGSVMTGAPDSAFMSGGDGHAVFAIESEITFIHTNEMIP